MDSARGGGGEYSMKREHSAGTQDYSEDGIQAKPLKNDSYAPPRVSTTQRNPASFSPRHSRRPSHTPSAKPPCYLLTVVPPLSIPHDPPHPKISPLAAGYGPRFGRGTLIPLYPTLSSQLGAIAREYGLPSSGGLCVYLVSTQDPSSANAAPMMESSGMAGEGGPRIGEEAWSLLWGRLFEAEGDEERAMGHGQGDSFTEDDEDYPPVPSIPSSYRANMSRLNSLPDSHSPYSPAVSPQHTRQYTEGESSIVSEGDLESDAGGSADSATTGFSKSARRVFSTNQSSATSRSGAGPSPNIPSPSARYSAPNSRNISEQGPRRSLSGARYDRSSRSSTYAHSNAGSPSSNRPLGGMGWGSSVIVGRIEFDIDRRNARGKWFDGYVEAAEAVPPPLPLATGRNPSIGARSGAKSADDILQATIAQQPKMDSPRRGLYLPSLVDMRQRHELPPSIEREEEESGEREEEVGSKSVVMETPEMRVRTASGRSRQITSSLSGYSIAPTFEGYGNGNMQRSSSASSATLDQPSIREAVRASFASNGYAMLNDEEDPVILSPAPSRRESVESRHTTKQSISSERSWRPLDDQMTQETSETNESTDVEANESDGTVQAGLGIIGVASPPKFTGLFVEPRGESDDESALPPPQDDVADIVQLLSANRKADGQNLASPIQLSSTFEQQATFPSNLLVDPAAYSNGLDPLVASPAFSTLSTDDVEEVRFLPRNSITRSGSHPIIVNIHPVVVPESPSPRASFRSPQRMGGQDWTAAASQMPAAATRWTPAAQSVEAIAVEDVSEGEDALRMDLNELEERLGQLSPRTREEAVALLLEEPDGQFASLDRLIRQEQPTPPPVDSSSYSASPPRPLSPPSPVIINSLHLPISFESGLPSPPFSANSMNPRVPRSSSLEAPQHPLTGPPIARSTVIAAPTTQSSSERTPTAYAETERFADQSASPQDEAPPVPYKIHFAPTVPPMPFEPPTPTQSSQSPSNRLRKSLRLSKPTTNEVENEPVLALGQKSPLNAFFDKKAFGFLKKPRKSVDGLSDSTSPSLSNVSPSSEAFPPIQPVFEPTRNGSPSPRRPSNPPFHDSSSAHASTSTLSIPPRPFRTESTESFATAFSTAPDDLNASTSSTIRHTPRSREEEYAMYRSSGGDEGEQENSLPTRYKASSIDAGTPLRSNYGPSTPLGLLRQNQEPAAPPPVTPSFENHRPSHKSHGSSSPARFVTPSTAVASPRSTPSAMHSRSHTDNSDGTPLTSSSSKYRLSEDVDLVDLLKQMEEIYDEDDDTGRTFDTSFSESSLSSLATGQASDESNPAWSRMSPVEEQPRVVEGNRRSEEESLL